MNIETFVNPVVNLLSAIVNAAINIIGKDVGIVLFMALALYLGFKVSRRWSSMNRNVLLLIVALPVFILLVALIN